MDWDNWLADPYSQKLIKIRAKVSELFKEHEDKKTLPFYTPHGVDHSRAVEDLIHKLIPDERYKELTEKERFLLLASAWLHDIGMLPAVAEEFRPALCGKPQEIRNYHHELSERYIVEHYARVGVDEFDKDVLGKLCRFHRKREDINACDEKLSVQKEPVRLRLLASYLRLADALDISVSRTPAGPYSMCLTYGIPIESKIHWIKSRIIHDIEINYKTNKILIAFREPRFDTPRLDEGTIKFLMEKLRSIITMVLEDLRGELFSVANVLIKGGVTFFLEIDYVLYDCAVDTQMQIDIREMVLNYDIMIAPNASKLLEMILISVANILGYSLYRNNKGETEVNDFKASENTTSRLNEFLNYLMEDLLKTRSCHLGLLKLVETLQKMIGKKHEINRVALMSEIEKLFTAHHDYRRKIRASSRKYFAREILNTFEEKHEINVLLYGYSEMVATVLCGFRDALIEHIHHDKENKTIRGSEREYNISKMINIFICEGQPKTQSSYGDHIIYHDGTQYSLYLRRRNFCNIALIPDIVAGNLIENLPIDLVIVGANGLDGKYFRHSAGHSSIINLAREYRLRKGMNQPSILLVCSSEKYFEKDTLSKSPMEGHKISVSSIFEKNRITPYCVDGYTYLKNDIVNIRESVWLLKDKEIMKTLCQNQITSYDRGQVHNIFLYNPREDVMPITQVDYIICENGYHRITGENHEKIIQTLFGPSACINFDQSFQEQETLTEKPQPKDKEPAPSIDKDPNVE